MVVVLILWLLCGVLCYFIMKSKGYPNNTCLKHGIGGFLLGFIWLIVVLVKKDYRRSGNDRLTNIEILEKLAILRSNGAISEEEYEIQKDQLLGNTRSKTTNTKVYRCPNCGANVQYGQTQCQCGQVFDWGHDYSSTEQIGLTTKQKFLSRRNNKVIVLIALILVAISAFSIHYLIQAKNIVNSDVYIDLRAQTFQNLSSAASNISFEYNKKDNAIEISSSIPSIRTTSFSYASLEFYTSWSTLCRTINTSTEIYQEAFSASGYDVDVVNTLYDETNTQVLFVSVNGETVYNYADK